MAEEVVERVTDELLADLIRQGECHARGSAFLSIFRELQERRRSPSPDAEAAKREAMRGGLLLDVFVERLRALSPPVEGE